MSGCSILCIPDLDCFSKNSVSYQRYRFLLFGFLFLFFLIFFRLFKIQIIDHGKYDNLAKQQHWRTLEIPPERGKIYSNDGFTLVDNRKAYLLFAHPKSVNNEKVVSQELADILFDEKSFTEKEKKAGLENLKNALKASLEEKLSKKDLYWVSLFHKLQDTHKKKIEELHIAGLGFEEETERYYPEGSLASFIMGFVGSNKTGEDAGYYGLEGYYNGDLKGEPGKVYEEQTAAGSPILLGGYKKIPPQNGRDLYTTVNRSIQYIAEQRIKNGVEKYKAKNGTVIILDPFSGAVLGMASYPSFDPVSWSRLARQIREGQSVEDGDAGAILTSFRNPAISETYEPGSCLKALTMSAGIATDAVTPQSTFNDTGPLQVAGYLVDNWDRRHWGIQTMIEVLQKSNNMGAAFVARTIGAATLREYFVKFGLGSRLGIDLEGEDSGVIKDLKSFQEIDLITNSFGQGISVTPLQMVSAVSAIANGGTLYKPYVVEKIKDGNKEINFKNDVIRKVMPAEKAKVMIEMLTAAAEGGEARHFILNKYKVAGKTGTAQIPTPSGYDPSKSNATFVGFLPESAKFVMLVRLSEPRTSIYAAETAVPLWMDITKDLVTYFGIPPDR